MQQTDRNWGPSGPNGVFGKGFIKTLTDAGFEVHPPNPSEIADAQRQNSKSNPICVITRTQNAPIGKIYNRRTGVDENTDQIIIDATDVREGGLTAESRECSGRFTGRVLLVITIGSASSSEAFTEIAIILKDVEPERLESLARPPLSDVAAPVSYRDYDPSTLFNALLVEESGQRRAARTIEYLFKGRKIVLTRLDDSRIEMQTSSYAFIFDTSVFESSGGCCVDAYAIGPDQQRTKLPNDELPTGDTYVARAINIGTFDLANRRAVTFE